MSLATILEILPPIDCIVLLKAKPNVTDSNGIMRIVTVSSQIDISVLAQRNMTKNNENSFWYFIDISQGSVAKGL